MSIHSLTSDEIAEQLIKAQEHYFNDEPIWTDDYFDYAKEYLRKIAPNHEFFSKIGADIKDAENRVTLPHYMGSLDKIRDDPKEITKWKGKYKGEYIVSDKLDGNSAMLIIDNDKDKQKHLYSRGNGLIGKNISGAIKYINVSNEIKSDIKIIIRGELIISKENWKKMTGSHPRNVANGAVQAKTYDPEILKYVDFVAYELIEPKPKTPLDGLKTMKEIGFNVVDYIVLNDDTLTFEKLSEELMNRRNTSKYDVDGIVINHNKYYKPISGKNPKYAFAMKSILTHDEAEVIVSGVEWNVSKDGLIKPRVKFNTVVIDGANIQQATGFNANYINTNGIGPGARITIIRSGSVIPHISKVISPSPNGPEMPKIKWTWNNTHIDAIIETDNESESDTSTLEKRLEHFVKKLNLKGIGPGLIKRICESADINSIEDFAKLTYDDLLNIDGFQHTSAKNTFDQIQLIRNATMIDMMVASNIFGRGMGKSKLQLILNEYPNMLDDHYNMIDMNIKGIGKDTLITFKEKLGIFITFITNIKWNKPEIKTNKLKTKCKRNPFDIPIEDLMNDFDNETMLKDEVIVFTGIRDKDLENNISLCGGKVTTTVTSKTTILVIPNEYKTKSGSHLKAEQFEIKIITIGEFKKKYMI